MRGVSTGKAAVDKILATMRTKRSCVPANVVVLMQHTLKALGKLRSAARKFFRRLATGMQLWRLQRKAKACFNKLRKVWSPSLCEKT